MYCPSAFRQDDLASLHRLMREQPFALLVGQGATGPQADHLPLLLVEDETSHGTLYGHFARANPQWRTFVGNRDALAVFSGPQAYVSPSWYPSKAEHGRAVPTWNYLAVQARGEVELFDDDERLTALLQRLTERHERGRESPWTLDEAPADYIAGMLRAVVGFALPIRQLEGKWKLSQNRRADDIAGVRQALAGSGDPQARALADHV